MKLLVSMLLGLSLLLAWPGAAGAQPSTTPPAMTEEGLPDDGGGGPYDVAALERGAPAPFSGILMSEQKATAYARLSLDVEELRGRLEVRERLLREVTEQLAEAQAAANDAADPGWWGRHGFVVGIVVGVVVTGALVWGSVEVLKARE